MGRKVKDGGGNSSEVEETRHVLQAVVLADSFISRFRPVTLERPKVLLPLGGAKHILDMNLEWLASAGVEEVLLLACAHASQIAAYVRNTWEGSSVHTAAKGIVVKFIECTDCLSAGDALRLLDQRNLVRGNFVLVHGDVISNMKLDVALRDHLERVKVDKQCIATLVMKSVGAMQRQARLGDADLVVAIDQEENRLVYYEQDDKKIVLDREACLDERAAIQVRDDLQDCDILICSPEALYVFRENFDYQRIREDFICGILSDETLGNKIFVHEIMSGEYAARIHNLRSYDAVARDIIARWTYPIVPEVDWAGRRGDLDDKMKLLSHCVYLEGVTLPISAHVGPGTLIGSGSTIGDGVSITSSIIGSGCTIGAGSIIMDSYIHDHVVIGERCTVRGAMLCDNVLLHEESHVTSGCVLSFNTVVGPKIRLSPGTKISLCRQKHEEEEDSDDDNLEWQDDSDFVEGPTKVILDAVAQRTLAGSLVASPSGQALAEGVEDVEFETEVVGALGAGWVWRNRNEDPEKMKKRFLTTELFPVSSKWWAEKTALDCAEAAQIELDIVSEDRRETDEASTIAGDNIEQEDDSMEVHFKREVTETFLRCVLEDFEHENVVQELNALKLAENRCFADIARYMFISILGLSLPAPKDVLDENRVLYAKESPRNKMEILKPLQSRLNTWRTLLMKYLRNQDDQIELLQTFEEYCLSDGVFNGDFGQKYYSPLFMEVLHLTYDADVLSEEAILQWAVEREGATGDDRRFLDQSKSFIDWLQNASEEEEESDDEEEES